MLQGKKLRGKCYKGKNVTGENVTGENVSGENGVPPYRVMDKSYVTNLLLRFFTFETENILIRNCPISLKFGVFLT